jgi:CheY-like chemotaxis protein
MASSDQTRLLIVEDVPQVAQYIRGLLNAQAKVKLLDVLTDGGKAIGQIQELRPDVVMVDALLQGRVKGLNLVDQIHKSGLGVPVIVMTVPQNPVEPDAERGIHGVLSMPFSGFDLISRIASVRKAFEAEQESAGTKIFSVFAPKGGVGKTTIAFNLAVSLGQLDQRTVLIDGSLQFGDLRALLKVPTDAPSILDLPTDRIAESDLGDVLWRDPSGIDILLAPPRIEMAEMVTVRDLEKTLSLLRRVYANARREQFAVAAALWQHSAPCVQQVKPCSQHGGLESVVQHALGGLQQAKLAEQQSCDCDRLPTTADASSPIPSTEPINNLVIMRLSPGQIGYMKFAERYKAAASRPSGPDYDTTRSGAINTPRGAITTATDTGEFATAGPHGERA